MNKGEIHVTNAIFNKTVAERFTFLKIKLFFPNLNKWDICLIFTIKQKVSAD